MKKIIMRGFFIAVFAIGIYACANAQPQDGDPDGDPDLVPLDPGSWVLVVAGVGYGVKKWRDTRQENKKTNLEDGNLLPEENANDNC
jgi:hypothetical protein